MPANVTITAEDSDLRVNPALPADIDPDATPQLPVHDAQLLTAIQGLGTPTIAPGDVEIGAVEIKDGVTDARAVVGAGNAAAVADVALTVSDPNVGAKITTLHADLVTANADLAQLHTDIATATHTDLAQLHTDLGAPADVVDLVGGATSIAAKLRGVVQLLVSMLASLVDVSGRGGREVLDRWTRPNDVTAYTINDLLRATTNDTATTGLRPLALARGNGKPFLLTHFSVRIKKTDFLPTLRAHFYLIPNPATLGGGSAVIPGDNSALSLIDANIPARIGSIDLPILALGHAADDYVGAATDSTMHYEIVPAAGDNQIYYALEIIAGASITPSALMQVSVQARSADL